MWASSAWPQQVTEVQAGMPNDNQGGNFMGLSG
jgi:hypothetical protein